MAKHGKNLALILKQIEKILPLVKFNKKSSY
jgi:hypothetical protein